MGVKRRMEATAHAVNLGQPRKAPALTQRNTGSARRGHGGDVEPLALVILPAVSEAGRLAQRAQHMTSAPTRPWAPDRARRKLACAS